MSISTQAKKLLDNRSETRLSDADYILKLKRQIVELSGSLQIEKKYSRLLELKISHIEKGDL